MSGSSEAGGQSYTFTSVGRPVVLVVSSFEFGIRFEKRARDEATDLLCRQDVRSGDRLDAAIDHTNDCEPPCLHEILGNLLLGLLRWPVRGCPDDKLWCEQDLLMLVLRVPGLIEQQLGRGSPQQSTGLVD